MFTLVCGNWRSFGECNMQLLHITSFTALLALAACSTHSGSQTATDPHRASSKRQVDVVVASYEGVQVWFGQAQGRFQASEQGFFALPGTTGAALGDLDADGDLDLFVTRYERHPNQVWFNDGKGSFRNSGQSLGIAENWRVTLGDLDRDGDLDAFVVGISESSTSPRGQPHEIWLNDGKGKFTRSTQPLRGDGYDVRLIDLNGDSNLDAVIAERDGIAIWLNEGNATLRERPPRLSRRAELDGRALSMGDLDRDGDTDIIFARTSQCEVWINRGQGEFDPGAIFATNFQSISVALGDLDRDGDLDIYLGTGMENPNRVLLNNGAGQFTDTGQTLPAGHTLDVALVDCDEDGDLDAIQANRNSPNRILLNDGKARFTDSGRNLGNSGGSWKSRRLALGSLR
jgi:hypothetical protein